MANTGSIKGLGDSNSNQIIIRTIENMIKMTKPLLSLLGLSALLGNPASALVHLEDDFNDREIGNAIYGSTTSDGEWTWTHGGNVSDSPIILDRDGDLYADMGKMSQSSMSWQKRNSDGSSGSHLRADPNNPLEIEFDYIYLTPWVDNQALIIWYLLNDRWSNVLATAQTDPQGYGLRLQVLDSSTLSYRLRHKAGGDWTSVPGSEGSFEVPGLIDPATTEETPVPGVPVRVRFRIEGNKQTLWLNDELQFDLDIENPHPQNATFSDNFIQMSSGNSRHRALDNLRIQEYLPPVTPGDIEPGDLYWTNSSTVRGLDFANGTPGDAAGNLHRAIGVAIDPINEHVYWTEDAGARLMRAGLDGSNPEEIVTMESVANSAGQQMGINPQLGKLYWAEFRKGVFMADLDGSNVEQILDIADYGHEYGSVVVSVDQTTGQVYWCSSYDGTIVRMESDGTSDQTLTSLGADTYGIAVDPNTERLYYTNFSNGNLGYLDLTTLTTTDIYWGAQPLGITVSPDGETLYWAERTDGKIQTAPVSSSGIGTVETLVTGEESPFGIALVTEAPSSGFDSWIAGFDLDAGDTGSDADPDGDGVSNLFEYALGASPTDPSRDGLPVQAIETINDIEHLTLTLNRNSEASDLTYELLASSNLVDWAPAIDAITVVDQPDQLKVAIPVSDGPDARQFLRLQVTRN